MKSVIVTTVYSELIPGYIHNFVSENEPNKEQLEIMLDNLVKALSQDWVIEYKSYDNTYESVKKYHYLLDGKQCEVTIKKTALLTF